MAEVLWSTTVDYIGDLASELIEGGCLILFGHPVPPALAEVSLVHNNRSHSAAPLEPGDRVHIDDDVLVLDEVGELATTNLNDLGHVVLYVNTPQQRLLPGALKASGAALPKPVVGTVISIVRGE